jgi:lipopolysaccharide biosynthesis glycosyltransferase
LSQQENKEVFIVLTCDNNYINYLLPCIKSIICNKAQDTILKINIFSDNIAKIYQNEIINQQTSQISINFIDILDVYATCNYKNILNTKQEQAVAQRLFIPLYFKNNPKILYLDADTIIQKDLLPLFNKNLENNYIAAFKTGFPNKNTVIGWKSFINKDVDLIYQKILNFDLNVLSQNEYINAGVILFNNQKIIKDNKAQELIDSITKFANQLPWIDQDILSRVFLHRIQNLEIRYNSFICNLAEYLSLSKANKKSYINRIKSSEIIHYIRKPAVNKIGKITFSHIYFKYFDQTSLRKKYNLSYYFYIFYYKNWIILKVSTKFFINKFLSKIFKKNFLDC